MDKLQNAFLPISVSLGFISLIIVFICLYRWAKKQKGVAMAFGILVQIFLPDPKVQQTIEAVSEAKQEERKASLGSQFSDKPK